MHVFVGIVATGDDRARANDEWHRAVQWVDRNPDALVPFPGHIVHQGRWLSQRPGVALYSWSNVTSAALPAIRTRPHNALALAGYAIADGDLTTPDALLERLTNSRRPGSVVAGLGGCFALCLADEVGLTAWTSRGRLESLFVTSTAGITVVSNRPRSTWIAANDGARPIPDPAFALQTLACGHPFGRATAWKDVDHVPDASRLEIPRHRSPSTSREDSLAFPPPPDPWVRRLRQRRTRRNIQNSNVELLRESLLASLAPLDHLPQPVAISLTGGKDSRLIAALLKERGIDFVTRTSGTPIHPDVIVAAQVAGILDVPHEVSPRSRPNGPDGTEFVAQHILGLLRNTDGMESGHLGHHAGPIGESANRGNLGGHGGEGMRGKIAARLASNQQTQPDIAVMVRSRLSRFRKLLTPIALAERHREASEWLTRHQTNDIGVYLESFYRDMNLGRWNMAGRLVSTHTAVNVSPYLDSAVIDAYSRIDAIERAGERPFHDLLFSLNPQLAQLDFADSVWLFAAQLGGTAPPIPGASAYDWRNDLSGTAGQSLMAIIDEGSGLELFEDIIDIDAFAQFHKEMIAGVHDQKPYSALFLWTFATMTLLWGHDWSPT